MEFIDLQAQYHAYKREIDDAIAEVLASCRFISGPQIEHLEEILAAYVDTQYGIGVSSGTDALLMALMAMGIGPGDEVITVPFTWISTAEVIRLVGARPIFVDVEERTFNMDLDQLEAAITPRTRAIMPVSLFGQMPDFNEINRIAAKHGLPVIEDGAQSFGATYKGRRSCGVTTVGTTSFFPAKVFGCYGDGGAIFTNDPNMAATLRALRNHGGERRHHHTHVGLNGRLDTLQAAILLVKFRHFPQEIAKRQEVAKRYDEALRSCCRVPIVAEGNTHVYAQYTLCHPQRDALMNFLKEKGIPTAIYYPKGIHEQPAFADCGYKRGDFPVTERLADEVVSLPMHPFLTEADQNRVIEAMKAFSLARV